MKVLASDRDYSRGDGCVKLVFHDCIIIDADDEIGVFIWRRACRIHWRFDGKAKKTTHSE